MTSLYNHVNILVLGWFTRIDCGPLKHTFVSTCTIVQKRKVQGMDAIRYHGFHVVMLFLAYCSVPARLTLRALLVCAHSTVCHVCRYVVYSACV